jgi:hypothetical protein
MFVGVLKSTDIQNKRKAAVAMLDYLFQRVLGKSKCVPFILDLSHSGFLSSMFHLLFMTYSGFDTKLHGISSQLDKYTLDT